MRSHMQHRIYLRYLHTQGQCILSQHNVEPIAARFYMYVYTSCAYMFRGVRICDKYQILKSLANSEDTGDMQRGIPYGSKLFANWEKYIYYFET